MAMKLATRALKALVDPAVCFTRIDLEKIVSDVIIQEAAIREENGQLPLTEQNCKDLRNMVIFRLCAEVPPAGNA